MVSRLLVGCGPVGQAVANELRDRPEPLTVLIGESARAETLRDEGLPAEVCDLADPGSLAAHDADVVFVADDGFETREVVAAVREAFPAAHLVVYGRDGVDDDLADEVVAPGELLGERVIDLVDGSPDDDYAGVYARRFRQTLRTLSGPLAVVMHDNPDPDAIGSGVALAALAERTGLETSVCYFGAINHQENRALVNLLELELRNLDAVRELEGFESVALVDHSRAGVNDQLPAETPVDLVVDHHPARGPIEARFVDLRQQVGATSTILADYHRKLGASLDTDVATALLYGIRVDTEDFTREAAPVDFEAAATLLPAADLDTLGQVESPSVSADTFDTIAAAVDNRRVEGSVLVSYVGAINDRDALAQAADMLLGMAGIDTTLVFGTMADTVYSSARARGTDRDLGATLREAFGRIGDAGGHAEMAGAQIPLGSLAALPVSEDVDRDDVIESVVAGRFLETIDASPPPAETPPLEALPEEYRGGAFGDESGPGEDA